VVHRAYRARFAIELTYVWVDYPKDSPKDNSCVTVTMKQRVLRF
jgi:hypothetical protein